MTAADTPPRSYGHYDVESELGRGAMGSVYLARDRRIGRRVALKTINIPERQFEDATAAKEFFKRLQREAEVSGSLQHRNIVTLYEAGYDQDRISYLAMELVEGETLQSMLKRERPNPLPVHTVLQIAEDVLRGLAHAHEKAIVHRDIKPANILINSEGTAKIADFGIARPQNSSMTAVGAVMGTPNYMSPEQVLSQNTTPRADIFSLGTTLYEMLTGVKPFFANDVTGILHNILRRDPPHVSDVNKKVPRGVGDLVARMLAKAPASRPFAAEALAEVERLRKPPAPQAGIATLRLRPSPPMPPPIPFWQRPVPAWLFAVTVLVFALGVGIALLTIRSRIDPTPTVTIDPEQLREFQEKRRILDGADALFAEKKYEEAAAVYEAYLEKYPQSTAAQEGLDRARAEIKPAAAPKTRTARKPPSKEDEDISPRELLDRIRKVFKP